MTDAYDSELVRHFTHSLSGICDVTTYGQGRKILLASLDAIREFTQDELNVADAEGPLTPHVISGYYRDMIDNLKDKIGLDRR